MIKSGYAGQHVVPPLAGNRFLAKIPQPSFSPAGGNPDASNSDKD